MSDVEAYENLPSYSRNSNPEMRWFIVRRERWVEKQVTQFESWLGFVLARRYLLLALLKVLYAARH
jgi:hypothetical protein